MATDEAIDYRTIFMHAPIGMCVARQRNIQSCNGALAAMFGYAPEALTGLSLSVLYPTQDEFERTGARIVPIMNATGHYSDERIMKRVSQELFWCHVSGSTLTHADPHAASIWTFEDLSEKRPVSVSLTPREREVAALLVEGKTSKLIARQVGLSPRTVEMHRASLMRKYAASTSSELIHRLLNGP